MMRSEAIAHHTEEAESAERVAARAVPGTPGHRHQTDYAREHRVLAEAARLGDYPDAELQD
ncbi:hypothetical protein V5N34_32035 [Streptomyces baarnensis]|uniref:hypothetical protein n=1 Tax=Streptomyces TaxID=1883 RepID=UPI0029B42A62|nr:hypothetical protein [Streptomyces sp. ME02-6979.5a]MDX3342716.1 hypothetical protein [Streptomyces sp. ME02-6979.5a]